MSSLFVLTLLTGIHTIAQSTTSMFIPQLTAQPLSADILGVNSQGPTTWAIHAGIPTKPASPGFEDSTYASLIYSLPSKTVAIDTACSIQSSLALCGGTTQPAVYYVPVQFAAPTSAVTTTTDSVFEGTGHVTLSDILGASSNTAGKLRVRMPFGLVGFEILVLVMASWERYLLEDL